jgi:hypothetical protein
MVIAGNYVYVVIATAIFLNDKRGRLKSVGGCSMV